MGKVILKTDLCREPEYLYYCATDKNGFITVCRAKMARGGRKKKK